jgi:primosomal protein N' (replication factor Y)
LVVVLLLDPLLNLPDYRANERVFGILERLKKLGQTLLIQTYNPELSLFSQAEKEDFSDFYKEQLKERRLFHYPPFSEIIKLTYSHKNSLLGEKAAKEFKKNLEKSLDNLPILGPAPGSIPKIKNKYLWHLVLKIPSSQADPVSKNASMKIRKTILNLLPKDWEIDINPQSLL